MKRNSSIKRVLSVILVFTMILCMAGCKKESSTATYDENLTFEEYMDLLLTEDLSSDPLTYTQMVENPKSFNITEYKHTISAFDKKDLEENILKTEQRLKQLESYDYDSLSKEQQLTYDTLKTVWSEDLNTKDLIYYNEPLSTLDGEHIALPGLISLHTARFFDTLSIKGYKSIDQVKEYFVIYEALGSYLESIAAFEREKADKGLFMSAERAKKVIDVCQQYVDSNGKEISSSFETELDQAGIVSEQDRKELVEENEKLVKTHIVSGYQSIIDAMKDCSKKDEKGKGLYETKEGKEFYEALIKSENACNQTPMEQAEQLETYVEQWKEECERLVEEDPAIAVNISNKLFSYQDTESVVQAMNEGMKKDFPDINITWKTEPMPEEMNNFAMGLFYPQPLDSTAKEHTIYAGTLLTPGMPTYAETIGHEGVPGHLYNYCYYNGLDLTKYRMLLGWTTFTGLLEGWTTYIEEYAYRYVGLTEREARYQELQRLLEMGIVQRIDIGVNYEGWDIKEIADYCKEISPQFALAGGYLKSIVSDSVNSYGPYVMGYINLVQIKDKMKQEMGDSFTDMEFHKRFLDVGPTNFELLNRELFD